MSAEREFHAVDESEDGELERVRGELMAREPIFHRPEFGATRDDIERMTAEDFCEIGASGRWYDREFVLDVLEERQQAPDQESWATSDFRCRRLAPDVFLLTYLLVQEGSRRTRRSTLWHRADGDWKILFHQGTIIQAE